MSTAAILPNGKNSFEDINGKPLVGGTVTFYEPGTLVLKDSWQDSTQTILNTNPIILDSRGQAIIYGYGIYRQRVKDSLGNLIWDELTAAPYSPSNPPPDAQFIYRDIFMEDSPTDGERYPIINIALAQSLPIALAGSVMTIDPDNLPTADISIGIEYRTPPSATWLSAGTIDIDTTGNVVVNFAAALPLAVHDQFSFLYPSPADATAGNIAIALVSLIS